MNRPLRPAPKPTKTPKKSRTTAASLRYMEAVKQLPCAVSGRAGPSDAHHCIHDRYGQTKSSDWHVIPLCKRLHQFSPDAIHEIKATWRERHGPDWSYIAETQRTVEEWFGITVPDEFRVCEDEEILAKWF